jgi:hypothetical protein
MLRLQIMALASLIALTAVNAAPTPKIVISALPFHITAPGTYTFTKNLTATAPQEGAKVALDISPGLLGPVVLDLGGFTLTALGADSVGILIGGLVSDPTVGNSFPITIENGTISACSFGVWSGAGLLMNDITIKKLTINVLAQSNPAGNAVGILLERTDNATIRNVTFNAPPSNPPSIGIQDDFSHGGNSYSGITFNGFQTLLVVVPDSPTPAPILNNVSFAEPVATP